MGQNEWNHSWSEWVREGYFVTFYRDNVKYYEYVVARDWAHWVYHWPETITSGATSGPYVPDELEITTGYDYNTNTNQIWQLIFGIKSQAYIYIESPTDTHRHGIPKVPKPSSVTREVSHFEEWMSPFTEPSFITEHFMIRPDFMQIGLDAYNPEAISLSPELNFMINKLITERIGTDTKGQQMPSIPRYQEILDKLCKKVVPSKPLTFYPVRGPAEAPGGM